MSRMPGMAVATTSSAPEDTRRFEIRFIPWSARYSSRASSGVIRRARTVPPPGAACTPDEMGLVVAEGTGPAEGGRDAGLALELDHEDRQARRGRPSGPARR